MGSIWQHYQQQQQQQEIQNSNNKRQQRENSEETSSSSSACRRVTTAKWHRKQRYVCSAFKQQQQMVAAANTVELHRMVAQLQQEEHEQQLAMLRPALVTANRSAVKSTIMELRCSNSSCKRLTQQINKMVLVIVGGSGAEVSGSASASATTTITIGTSSVLDSRSCLSLMFIVLIYCCVLIRASTTTATMAAATTTTTTTPTTTPTTTTTTTTRGSSAAIMADAPTLLRIVEQTLATSAPSAATMRAINVAALFAVDNTNADAAAAAEGSDVAAGALRRHLKERDNTEMTMKHKANATHTTTTIEASKNNRNDENSIIIVELRLRQENSLQRRQQRERRDVNKVPSDDDGDDSSYRDDDIDEYDALIRNKSAKGKYIGAQCNELKCEATLLHVSCDEETRICGCERNYPVQLGLTKGCDKPKKLGEQCFYDETCMYNDENSLCVQVRHNALCQCANGFHSVSYTKPTRRIFCTQDIGELTSDLPTLLGVSTGIAVLAGLICMVLHLFSKTKYPRHRNFGDASLPPPIMYSSDTGLPLTVHSGRPSSRSSLRSSGSIGSYGNRRSSSSGCGGGGGGGAGGTGGFGGGGVGGAGGISGGSKGILVSTSRTGSRRPSLASVHSTSSSVRSYSMMRFEKESQQKEIRQEMKLRLARLQQQQHLTQNKPQIIVGDTLLLQHHGAISRIAAMTAGGYNNCTVATPSPLTPNSLDELLPTVEESQEYPSRVHIAAPAIISKSVAADTLAAIKKAAAAATSTPPTAASRREAMTATVSGSSISSQLDEATAYIGPCSSSTEAID